MEKLLSRLPFMAAFIVALSAMPLDTYVVNRRQLGIVRFSGFCRNVKHQISSFAVVLYEALRGLFRTAHSPGWRYAGAIAVMALMISGVVPSEGAVLIAGITADEAREQINKLGTDMSAILKTATDEKRELNTEEATKFDKMDADREALLKQERRLIVAAELDGTQGRRSAQAPPAKGDRTEETREDVNNARLEGMRSWLLAGSDRVSSITPEQRAIAAKVGFAIDQKHLKFTLPRIGLRSMDPVSVRDWEARALSSSSATSPVDGQYTVANEMMAPLEKALLAFGGMRRFATIWRTNTGADLPIPTSNDTSNTGEIIGQNTAVNQQDVAFSQLVLQAWKYSSKMILVPVELLQDSSVNIAEFLGQALGERIGRITNTHFTTGDASSKPNGIVTAATNSTIQLAAKTPTLPELVSIQHSVDPSYRELGTQWMFHDSMLAECKKIVDADSGRPIWMASMAGGVPDTILGDSYVVNQAVAAAAASGAAKSILYGALSKYIIRDVRDITLLRLDERFAEYHQVAFLAFSRHDGDLLDAGTHPVKYAVNKT
jgi:HK97 family phage major capsid protein